MASVAVEHTLQTGTFPVGAPCFHTEIAYVSVGVHNEHFLHHRRDCI